MSGESRGADADGIRPMMLRYLDGTLSPEGVAELNESLRNDQELRREFAELLYEHAHLAELCKEKAWTPPELAVRRHIWRRNVSRRLWVSAAAVAGILIAGWLLMPTRYPAPQISGSVRVVGDGQPKPGAFLHTGDKPGRLMLGGYCRLEIDPNTSLVVEGKERDESVFVGRGSVTCEVDHREGKFAVRTEVGTVSATGTKFNVRVFEKRGEGEMKASKVLSALTVAVMAGTVSVEYDGKSYELAAGADRTFGAEGRKQTWTFGGKGAKQKWSQGRAEAEKKIAEMHERFLAARKRHRLPGQGKGRVIGFVIDAETGKPPEGVVIVGSKGREAEDARPEKTGGLRMYELVVDPGVWRIEARAEGYQTATVENVRVLPGHGPGKGTWLIFRMDKGQARAVEKPAEGRARAEKKIAELHKMFQNASKRAELPRQGKGRVIGFVIDAETGEPPEGAVIVGFKDRQVADARPERTGELRGMYELTVDPGIWRIEARAAGYQTATVNGVRVTPGHGSGMGTWLIFRLEKGRNK